MCIFSSSVVLSSANITSSVRKVKSLETVYTCIVAIVFCFCPHSFIVGLSLHATFVLCFAEFVSHLPALQIHST